MESHRNSLQQVSHTSSSSNRSFTTFSASSIHSGDENSTSDHFHRRNRLVPSIPQVKTQLLHPRTFDFHDFRSSTNDHEATAMMKTQFMMLWDGLSTENGSTVIVMGATNRPNDLDRAILRRMPAQFHVSLPDEEQRFKILKLILENEKVASSVNYHQLAKATNSFSGSDLRE
jgi:SpoVK/Ycf46/Vps4 family AAA+-type ATPase